MRVMMSATERMGKGAGWGTDDRYQVATPAWSHVSLRVSVISLDDPKNSTTLPCARRQGLEPLLVNKRSEIGAVPGIRTQPFADRAALCVTTL